MLTRYESIPFTTGQLSKNGSLCSCHCCSSTIVSTKWLPDKYLTILTYPLVDPFFPLIFLMNSWLPGMLDAILQATFLCALLMFWLCIYHGLRQNERRFVSFYLVKIIVVLPIWLCAIVLATWEKCNELKDPTYSHFVDTKNYNVSAV